MSNPNANPTVAAKKQQITAAVIQALHDSDAEEFKKRLASFSGQSESIKKLQIKMKESTPESGVFLYVLRADWIKDRESKKIAQNVTFPEYHEKVVGKGKKPNRHAESCAHCFAVTVGRELMEEQTYWDNPANALEVASGIFTAVNDDMNHPAAVEAVGLLEHITKDQAKNLKGLRDRLVVQTENEGTDQEKIVIVFLSEEEAAKKDGEISVLDAHVQIDGLLKAGHIGAVIGALTSLAKETDSAEIAETLAQAAKAVAVNLRANADKDGARRWPDETLRAWSQGQTAPASETPAPETAPVQIPESVPA
jgi:hypothetical protein